MIELIETYLIGSFIIYFFPFLLSLLTGNRTVSVFVMNLFLGWTFIGWIWALIWAVTSAGNRNQVTVHNYVANDKSQYPDREIIVPQTTFIEQPIDKPSLLNQLSQLHALKEKNVITDSIYEQQRKAILEKLQGAQAKQTETTIISEPEASREVAFIVYTIEQKELLDEEYNTIFNQKNWLQRNHSWVIGFLIASVAAFCIWHFGNENFQSSNVAPGNDAIFNNLKFVKIGDQNWMTQNLNVSHFKNGDRIPEAKSNPEWIRAGKMREPVWCYYEGDSLNGTKYGKMYNWFAINDPRELAPKGWHLPSDKDWSKLKSFLGKNAGEKMRSKEGWEQNKCSNESGFNGLPAGGRSFNGEYYPVGVSAYWWSANGVVNFDMNGNYSFNALGDFYKGEEFPAKQHGFSIRCLKD